MADEVDRWTRAFATLPAELAGDYQRAARALRASVPAALPPAVNHGDFRLGNTLCAGGRINAVIHWEIWSGTVAGTPAGRELEAAYEDTRGAPVPDLGWFDALTRYKEAGVTGLLLKRAHKLGRPLKPSMARMRPALPRPRVRDWAGMGVCLDAFHVWTEGGLREQIGAHIGLAAHVQLSDMVRGARALPCRTVPGEGDVPRAAIVGWLLAAGYPGVSTASSTAPPLTPSATRRPRRAPRRGWTRC